MRFFNPKKIEFLIKNFFGFSDAFLLKRRANRYLRKNTEREIRVLEKLVDPNKASIDIGVYRGVYSYYLTNLTKFVYAFEANPLLLTKIKNSFKNKNNFILENMAVSSSISKTDLRIPLRDINAEYDYEQKYRLGTATIHNVNKLENKEFEIIRNIRTITLDEYNFMHNIGFVKIDVEGHELDVIEGAKNFIKKHMPNMLIEIEKRHSGIDPKVTIMAIESLGYETYYVNKNFKITRFDLADEKSNHNFIFLPK